MKTNIINNNHLNFVQYDLNVEEAKEYMILMKYEDGIIFSTYIIIQI